MNAFEHWIDRCSSRLAMGRLLESLAGLLAVFLFVFGTAVLVVKLAAPEWWPQVLWLGLGVAPVAVWAWRASRRRAFTRRETVALLDQRVGAGGLLMTLSESPDLRWSDRLPRLEAQWSASLPKLRPVRFARLLALPAVFALAACFIPLRQAQPEPILKQTVSRTEARELEEILDSLEETSALDKEERDELREEIQKLQEETKDAPLTHEKWETVDALRQKMQTRVESAAATVTKALEAAMSLDGGPEGQELDDERKERLEQDLLDALRKMAENGAFDGATAANLPDALKQLIKQNATKLPLDETLREELLDELQEFLDQESAKLAECRGKCQNPGSSLDAELAASGINRGPGEAQLGERTKEEDERASAFKNIVLPPGYLDDANKETLGAVKSAPSVDPDATATRAPTRLTDPAAGRETWKRRLRPRHQQAVRKYFDSER